jgi:predicted acyltransferase
MQLIEKTVVFLKILFIVSAFLKFIAQKDRPKLTVELRIVRMLYYNTSLLLFLYWFNPWTKMVCLEGEEKLIVFSFVLIEFIEEFFPDLF